MMIEVTGKHTERLSKVTAAIRIGFANLARSFNTEILGFGDFIALETKST